MLWSSSKKTLPSASSSFVQLKVSSSAQRVQALRIIREASAKSRHPELDLIALALSGKTEGFKKVLAMIDEMVANLKKEQEEDDSKKEYCEKEFDETDDKKKGLVQSVKDSETAIDKMKSQIEKLTEENAEYKELISSDSTAKEVLGWAKNRLNKFYNPK